MNIKSIVDNNFSTVFQGFEEAEREAQRKAVGYIMQLAAQTHTDISTWDLFEVFGQGNGRIYVAKPAINQRFFAKRDTQAPAEVQDIDKLVPALAERLMRPIARRRESIIRQAEQTRDQYINNAIGYFQRAEGYLKEAAKSHASAAAVDLLSAANATEEIVKVVKAGFWELVEAGKEDHRLHFITRSDCYLRHQNPAAGVDINLNMGKFRCSVDPAEAHVRVKGEGNNIRYAQYVHPHVSGNGEVCWGNAKDMVARDLPRLKLSGVLEALATILTNYNKDSPYIAIETMEQVVRRGPFIRCDDCGNNYWENEGACCTNEQTCYVCGSSYVEDDGRACECCYECENATCTCNEEEEDTGEDGIVEIAPQEEIVEAPSLSEAEAALRRYHASLRESAATTESTFRSPIDAAMDERRNQLEQAYATAHRTPPVDTDRLSNRTIAYLDRTGRPVFMDEIAVTVNPRYRSDENYMRHVAENARIRNGGIEVPPEVQARYTQGTLGTGWEFDGQRITRPDSATDRILAGPSNEDIAF